MFEIMFIASGVEKEIFLLSDRNEGITTILFDGIFLTTFKVESSVIPEIKIKLREGSNSILQLKTSEVKYESVFEQPLIINTFL